MATRTFFINSDEAVYGHEEFNALPKLLLQPGVLNTEGADWEDWVDNGDLKVTERGAGANMSVDVNVGWAIVPNERETVPFSVFVQNNEVVNLEVPPNSSGNDRVDAVILRVSRSVEPNPLTNNVATIEYVEGIGDTAMSDEQIASQIDSDDDFLRLADVTIAESATEVQDADIADTRARVLPSEATTPASAVYRFRAFATDPATDNLEAGDLWYNSTDGGFRYYDGSGIIIITPFGSAINAAAAKTTPADDDMLALMDSAASNLLKKLSWANLKARIASATMTLTNKTLTSPVMNVGSDAQGDIYYRNNDGQFVRLPIGAEDHVLKSKSNVPSWEDAGEVSSVVHDAEFIVPVDGTTIPVPIAINEDGRAYPADASDSRFYAFAGFLSDEVAPSLGDFFVNAGTISNTGSVSTMSLTANAGEDRILIIAVRNTTFGGAAAPTGFTWNGVAMTEVGRYNNPGSGGANFSLWYLPIGSSESNQTADLVRSGGGTSGSVAYRYAFSVYDNIDQIAPVIDDSHAHQTGSSGALSLTDVLNLIVGCSTSSGSSPAANVSNAGYEERASNQDTISLGEFFTTAVSPAVTGGGGGQYVIWGIALNISAAAAAAAAAAAVAVQGIVSGFSGLTPGERYYVTDTAGEIGTTPGSETILVGMALSETQILIMH